MDAVDPPSTKKKTKKDLELERIAIVVVPLDTLDAKVQHPRQFLIAKASFEAAIDSKISGWEKEDVDGEMVSKADTFMLEVEEYKDEPDVVGMGCSSVADSARQAADALKSFKESMGKWKVPLDVLEHTKTFEKLSKSYDTAVEQLQQYTDTILGYATRREADAQTQKDKAKTKIKNMTTNLFTSLSETGNPRLVAKADSQSCQVRRLSQVS